MSEQQLKNDIDMLDGTLDGSMVEPEEVAAWERVKSALQSAHATRSAPAGSGEAVYQCRRNGEAWVDLSKAEFDFAKGRNDFSDVEFRMLYPAQPAPQRVAVPEEWKVEREEEPDGFKITFANGGTLRVCEETSGAVEHTLCMLLSHISAAPQPDGVGDGMQARHDLMLALFKRYRYETPMHVLQELGGWESPQMLRRYAHFSREHLAEYVGRLHGTKSPTPEVERKRG